MNVVFDFGAVLFTWQPTVLLRECFPLQATTPAQAGQLAHAVFAHPDWLNFDRGTLTMNQVVERTAQRLGLDRTLLGELVRSIGDRLTPMPDSVEVLTQLHARRNRPNDAPRLYYLSNMPVPYARTLERLHGFLKFFDGGIFSADVGHIKPEPEIYRLLQTRHALEPAETVLIDDLPANVQAAQAQGWQGIHFESAAQVRDALGALNISK